MRFVNLTLNMKPNEQRPKLNVIAPRGFLWLVMIQILVVLNAEGTGSWNLIPAVPPPDPVHVMILLSDGTVLASGIGSIGPGTSITNIIIDPSKRWFRMTPGIGGDYKHGTWLPAADMHDSRAVFSSVVLKDGRVLVAGGEYGSGATSAEIYDPMRNEWTLVSPPSGLIIDVPAIGTGGENRYGFSDACCKILPNGNVLFAPVFPVTTNGTVIYDPVANQWFAGPVTVGNGNRNQNEVSWVKLPDDSILSVDKSTTNSERYIPSLNQWIPDANLRVDLFDHIGEETGPAFLLPDGRAFFLGGTENTAIYTPSPLGGTNQGIWRAGPKIPGVGSTTNGAPDAPAAMMPNGQILCAVNPIPTGVSPNTIFNGPTLFFEYSHDGTASGSGDSFVSVPLPLNHLPPGIDSWIGPAMTDSMLVLPDGTIFYAHVPFVDPLAYPQAATEAGLYVYTPDGGQLASGKPTVTGIVPKTDGTYHLIGTGFNGISEGAAYGDDAQMDSNYPLVRLTDALGIVHYARTYNWSSTSVMTGNRLVTTEFELPSLLPPGNYTLQVVVNGNASDSIPLPHVVYVDKNTPCLTIDDLPDGFRQFAQVNPPPGLYYGTLDCLSITLSPPGLPSTTFGLGGPFRAVGDAVASASSNDRIQIKVGNYNEKLTIRKPLTIDASDGSVFIGKP